MRNGKGEPRIKRQLVTSVFYVLLFFKKSNQSSKISIFFSQLVTSVFYVLLLSKSNKKLQNFYKSNLKASYELEHCPPGPNYDILKLEHCPPRPNNEIRTLSSAAKQ
jgi:hypothetical protein